jgi:signal transduction histidine kinase
LQRILAERSALGAFGATVVSIGLLVAWTKELRPGWVIAAAVAHVVASLLFVRARRRLRAPVSTRLAAALAIVLLGIGTAAAFTWQFQRLDVTWPELVARRDQRQAAALEQRMADVAESGRRAAEAATHLLGRPAREQFRELAELRERAGMDALALLSATGEPIAWAGEHRGLLPDSVCCTGTVPYFGEGPLFSYLYFPHPAGTRGDRAVAAVLLETGFADLEETGFDDVFAGGLGSRASFRRGGGPDAVWALTAGADTVVHARLARMTQAEWRAAQDRTARRTVLLAVLLGHFVLSLAWLRWTAPAHSRWAASLPLLLAVPLLAGLPLRGTLGEDRIFSPTLFILTLPIRGDISLGRLLVLLVPIGALVAGLRRVAWHPRLALAWLVGGALAVAVAYPLLIDLLLSGASSTLLLGPAAYWIGFQIAAVLTLACVTLLAMPRAVAGRQEPWRVSRRTRRILLAAGALLAVGLGMLVAIPPQPGQPLRVGVAALWVVPFVLLAVATASRGRRAGTLMRWLTASSLAATAVLPQLWSAHLQARLASAEADLRTLGEGEGDPFLISRLEAFGREAQARFAAGEEGVLLLYRSWVASRLAREPYPVRLYLWSPDGYPELQLGSAPALKNPVELERLVQLVADARAGHITHLEPFRDPPSESRILTVPLPDSTLITVVVPPRRTLERTSSIAPFLGVVDPARTRLHLVQAGEARPTSSEVEWVPQPEGWRSEAWVKYPDGWYHAHLLVTVPSLGVRLARATLLLTFDLAMAALLWLLGVVGRGATAVPRGDWTGWLGSFRARITVALFAFFLLPTALFGWVAYRALAGEVARAAATIAQYSARQAVAEFDDAGGNLLELAAHAGTDVLLYQGGALLGVSSPEAFDLGIYSAWMPPDVYLDLVVTREDREAIHAQTLRNRTFITAYSALVPAGTLGVPLSLSTGDAAVRQTEFAHLVLFAAVVGAVLSLALSLAVGRALARPIGRLRRAASVVGAGELRVHLPETRGDEFGELFAAFNRMVRRLRRARAREIRTARVLAWGEMARQVAHEIKNPLTPIKLSVQHLRRAYADRHRQFEDILDTSVSQILSEIDRLSDIARAFSRYGAPAEAAGPLGSVDAPAVIREALTLYRSGDRDVRYIDAVEADLPRVLARADELKEVLLNLVENAHEALDGSGEVVVRGRAVGDRVEIAVGDNGHGIPPELLPRIFDPHFSTRSVGTGLGLAIVRRIVESWGGTVTAESEPGRGTTVIMRLVPANS